MALSQGSSLWGKRKLSVKQREKKEIFAQEVGKDERAKYRHLQGDRQGGKRKCCRLEEDNQGGESKVLPPLRKQPMRATWKKERRREDSQEGQSKMMPL